MSSIVPSTTPCVQRRWFVADVVELLCGVEADHDRPVEVGCQRELVEDADDFHILITDENERWLVEVVDTETFCSDGAEHRRGVGLAGPLEESTVFDRSAQRVEEFRLGGDNLDRAGLTFGNELVAIHVGIHVPHRVWQTSFPLSCESQKTDVVEPGGDDHGCLGRSARAQRRRCELALRSSTAMSSSRGCPFFSAMRTRSAWLGG